MLIVAGNFSTKKITNPFATPTPYPTSSNPKIPASEETSITPASSKNIEVLSPLSGDIVKSGFVVKGNARVFENVVSIRLMDSLGGILSQTTTLANAPDAGKFGPFDKTMIFQTDDISGTLEIYQSSAKDGSEIDKVTIPLLFSK